jgi:16S rRNA (cytidine1402-2'-O)-methyltransferase
MSLAPILYLIPVPIAEDTLKSALPDQVVEIVKECKVLFVENIRTARRFIASLKAGIVIDDLEFFELFKGTEDHVVAEYAERLRTLTVPAAIMSEAGCPGVADPGSALIALAHEMNVKVVPLVGPNSMTLLLMASGLNGQRYTFNGYLPINNPQRRNAIIAISAEVQKSGTTQLFMETPFRNNSMLKDVLSHCPKSMKLCIGSDLTGATEMIRTLTIAEWNSAVPELHKIPTVFALGV